MIWHAEEWQRNNIHACRPQYEHPASLSISRVEKERSIFLMRMMAFLLVNFILLMSLDFFFGSIDSTMFECFVSVSFFFNFYFFVFCALFCIFIFHLLKRIGNSMYYSTYYYYSTTYNIEL